MREALLNFNRQFEFEPVLQNTADLGRFERIIVSGMGGSHLAADIFKAYVLNDKIELIIHNDYGLPNLPDTQLASTLFIASSYSGNTEEVLDGLNQALALKMRVCLISVGGKLKDIAQTKSLPYIELPNAKVQPRNALGYSFRALLKATGYDDLIKATSTLTNELKPGEYEERGKGLAGELKDSIPVIYSSKKNEAIAFNWKIKLNETGKIPAFYNTLPELNHNEMTGFDVKDQTRRLTEKFHFLFLEDSSDHPQIRKRMAMLTRLYKARGLKVTLIPIDLLDGNKLFVNIFSNLILADWTAYYTALGYGLEPEPVHMVEEFKKLIK